MVGFLNRREVVSNNDSGPVLGDPVQSVLHDTLTTYVNRAGRFVKNQYSWVSNNASCNRNSLSLATTQFDAAPSNLSFVALRQLLDELIGESLLTSFLNLESSSFSL